MSHAHKHMHTNKSERETSGHDRYYADNLPNKCFANRLSVDWMF